MSMPKGFKTRKGYATVTEIPGGMDYRRIAEKMSESGDKMNHATARNIFLKAMMKFAAPIHELYQLDTNDDAIMSTAKDPEFQSGVIDIMDEYSMDKIV
jgi:hypothetical protein